MNRRIALIAVGLAAMTAANGCGEAVQGKPQQQTALRFQMASLDGQKVDLARYAGKVVMVVNVASKCGFTPQYTQLQALHEKYSGQGLAVLGFPCNQFLGQEPGSAEEIQQFCRTTYGVTFDMFAKVEVKGDRACDLYRLLTSLDTKPKGAGEISWNFEKFVLDRNGFVVARFPSATKPDAPEVVQVIERELARQADPGGAPAPTAQGKPRQLNLAEYQWKNRLVLLFAPSPDAAVCRSFRRAWNVRPGETADRDLLLIELFDDGESRVAKAPISAASAAKLRSRFRVEPGATIVILVGKDGSEKLRKADVGLDELFEVIDAMPMRQREMKQKRQQ